MVQLDLFATRPPPRPEPPTDNAVVAAVDVEQRRRLRSEVKPAVPFVTGPVSDATGGPLSGEEAQRVLTLRTIRCSGWLFQDGAAFCKPCFGGFSKAEVDALHALHGYRGVLYGGAEYRGGLTCGYCEKPIAP